MTPTPKVCEEVFIDAYRRKRGVRPTTPQPPQEVVYHAVPGVVRPRTEAGAEWYDRVVDRPLDVVLKTSKLEVDVPKACFQIGGLTVTVGAGGLHTKDSPGVYHETANHAIVNVDVSSFYPSLIAKKGISPAAPTATSGRRPTARSSTHGSRSRGLPPRRQTDPDENGRGSERRRTG